jgi:hypothetical protein
LILASICIYEESYSTDYDAIKKRHGLIKSEWIDAGKCSQNDLELLLGDTASGKLKFFMPTFVDDVDMVIEMTKNMFIEFDDFIKTTSYVPIAIMPLKLFKMEIIQVERNSWQKIYNKKSRTWEMPEEKTELNFVQTHQETIERVVEQIRFLDNMTRSDQIQELDILYSPPCDISDDICNDLVNSLLT